VHPLALVWQTIGCPTSTQVPVPPRLQKPSTPVVFVPGSNGSWIPVHLQDKPKGYPRSFVPGSRPGTFQQVHTPHLGWRLPSAVGRCALSRGVMLWIDSRAAQPCGTCPIGTRITRAPLLILAFARCLFCCLQVKPGPRQGSSPAVRPNRTNLLVPVGPLRTPAFGNYTPASVNPRPESFKCLIPMDANGMRIGGRRRSLLQTAPVNSGMANSSMLGAGEAAAYPPSSAIMPGRAGDGAGDADAANSTAQPPPSSADGSLPAFRLPSIDDPHYVHIPRPDSDGYDLVHTCQCVAALRTWKQSVDSSQRRKPMPAFIPNTRLGSWVPVRLEPLDLCSTRGRRPPPPRVRGNSSYWEAATTVSYVPGLVGATYLLSSVSSQSNWLKPGAVVWAAEDDGLDTHILVPGTVATVVIPIPATQAATTQERCQGRRGSVATIEDTLASRGSGTASPTTSSNSGRAESTEPSALDGMAAINMVNSSTTSAGKTTGTVQFDGNGTAIVTATKEDGTRVLEDGTASGTGSEPPDCSHMLVLVPGPSGWRLASPVKQAVGGATSANAPPAAACHGITRS
jgi:hypothetical protein